MPPNAIEKIEEKADRRDETSQQFSVLFQKIMGLENTPNFTKEQIDELLSQRRQIAAYIHEDRKTDSYDTKFYLVAIIAFILFFSGLVLRMKPEIFSEVLSLIVGLLGGGAAGFGIGKIKN